MSLPAIFVARGVAERRYFFAPKAPMRVLPAPDALKVPTVSCAEGPKRPPGGNETCCDPTKLPAVEPAGSGAKVTVDPTVPKKIPVIAPLTGEALG